MFKFCFFIVVATQFMGRTYGSLSRLLALPIDLTSDLQGIEIGALGPVGYIAIPFNTVCRTPLIDQTVVCALCNQDCIYAHNAFGGNCGPDPLNPLSLTCLCAYTQQEADAMQVSLSTIDTCSSGYSIIPELACDLRDDVFEIVIRKRARILQCASINHQDYQTTSACNADCKYNHGRKGGTCRFVGPLAPGLGNVPSVYCECI